MEHVPKHQKFGSVFTKYRTECVCSGISLHKHSQPAPQQCGSDSTSCAFSHKSYIPLICLIEALLTKGPHIHYLLCHRYYKCPILQVRK